MRLLDAVFDVLRRAGEPLSPAEIVRQIRSASVPLDANEPIDDESVKVELEHVADDGSETSGIVRTPSGRFTLPALIDRTVRTGTSIGDIDGVNDQSDQYRVGGRPRQRWCDVDGSGFGQRNVAPRQTST